ncbi:hypothetical protein BKA62DRAFT_812954 [Auriculariales sp. MPI-PUGE-AT-0066]|nr:hypothetical protein BKA62DRAFT_812954 [Auriculariales sp. MPI-PUGE-AT-0066]
MAGEFTTEHAGFWLDDHGSAQQRQTQSDTNYMIKFAISHELKLCCVMITDTKSVFGEVLPFNSLARRWASANPTLHIPLNSQGLPDDTTIKYIVEVLSIMHTIKHMSSGTLKVSEDYNSDLAIDLATNDYSWRWNALAVGLRTSADLISTHLITPLLTFSWASLDLKESMKQVGADALEKHLRPRSIQHRKTPQTLPQAAFRKPKLTTALCLIHATFLSRSDLPSIVEDVDDDPELPEPVLSLQALATTSFLKRQLQTRHRYPQALHHSETETESGSSNYEGGPGGSQTIASLTKAQPTAVGKALDQSGTTSKTNALSKASDDDSRPTGSSAQLRMQKASSKAKSIANDSSEDGGPSAPKKSKAHPKPSDDSDTDGPPVSKKAKSQPVQSESDSDSPPKPTVVSRLAGVRQPARRGRRF